MNTVLASHKMFLLGPWIDRYVSWAPNEESKSKTVIAAKTRISTWGPKEWSEGMKLHDYSFREWEGIMSELYKGRWEKYLTALENSIQTVIPETIDWYAYDLAWIHNGNTYNSTSFGSQYHVCKKVYRKYRHKMYLYQ
jgi:alpha-N-acetylglucosaminidase